MPTRDYTIECLDVEVEYDYEPAVKDTFDAQGHDASVTIQHVMVVVVDPNSRHKGQRWHYYPVAEITMSLPPSILDDIREHILQGELAGPDPDKENDRRRDDG